jgi:predicted membrane GTPase involved in stress response
LQLPRAALNAERADEPRAGDREVRDELVEVTPKVIRIRKRHLDPHERKRAARKLEAA